MISGPAGDSTGNAVLPGGRAELHEPHRAPLRALKQEGRAGLVTYLTAGDPDPETSLALFRGLAAAGADLIEIGMPFSDPMADGPAIQAAGQRALEAGHDPAQHPGDGARAARAATRTRPIVLMGYYNPIYRYGAEAFARDAVAAGVDGAIIVDLPPEEDAELAEPARAAGLDFVRLATPTSDDARLPAIVEHASGFIYYVAIAGITGTRSADAGERRRGGRPAAPVHRSAGRGRLRHQNPGAGRRGRQGRRRRRRRHGSGRSPRPQPRPRRQGKARASSTPCSPTSARSPRVSAARAESQDYRRSSRIHIVT